MNNVFTVPEVPNSKRTSPRNYTHAVIGQFNYEQAIAAAQQIAKHDLTDYDYYLLCSKCNPGDVYPKPEYKFPVDAEMITRGKEKIAQYPTAEAFQIGMRDARVKKLTEQKEKGGEPFIVLQWSQSAVNAQKSLGSHRNYYKNVKVVETVKIR